ncbi:hypothetical protein Pmani_005588 [Petrolisthes manimaculis]|uniref:Uncharacterized protein n=1 Tax=Petrolisthes manimaculis TaxID=1843537 RepID=A0AAE1QEP0_9EUCA|nr:hypothetical protein Pmani_005588 [Petrolisthes manimaculis]
MYLCYLSQCLPERGQGRSDQSRLTYLTQTTSPVVWPLLRPPPTLLYGGPSPPLLSRPSTSPPSLPTLRRALSPSERVPSALPHL